MSCNCSWFDENREPRLDETECCLSGHCQRPRAAKSSNGHGRCAACAKKAPYSEGSRMFLCPGCYVPRYTFDDWAAK